MNRHTTVEFLYKKLLKPVLFALDPEFVHDTFTNVGEFMGTNALTRTIIGGMYGYHGADISKTVDGITYRTPVLLSAGFDYNAKLVSILDQMGFGGAEFGSVTLRPYVGNAKPRLTRAVKSKSIIVNKGLKNEGVDKIIERMKRKKVYNGLVRGVSIARTNDSCTATDEAGIEDYAGTLEKLVAAGVGDYYTINISCPNAFGGETFAEKTRLPRLLARLKQIKHDKPMYVKMPINPEWNDFEPLVHIVQDAGFNGVVIGNLNKNYDEAAFREEFPKEYRGGLSGRPCWERSNNLISKTKETFGDSLTIMGVGGIFSPDDAMEKIRRGADLVQLITGMFMEGPHLISQIAYRYEQETTR